MKGKKCIRLLILFITFLLLSNQYLKVNAIDLSIDVTQVGNTHIVNRVVCRYTDGSVIFQPTGTNYCPTPKSINEQVNLTVIQNPVAINLTQGNYYRGFVSILSDTEGSDIILRDIKSNNNVFDVFQINEITKDYLSTHYVAANINDGTINLFPNANEIAVYSGEYSKFYEIILKARVTTSQYWGFGINSTNETFYTNEELAKPPLIYLYQIDEFKPNNASEEMNEKDDQDRENLETQQTESEASAGESSEDLGSATTNITGIVSTFLGNLQNLNANQCTLPEIEAYGFSLGQLNLCTFRPPNWVQGISSAVVSLMMLGLAVHLFRRIMGIAKGLAGSK